MMHGELVTLHGVAPICNSGHQGSHPINS